jgi:hypothetical protein
MSKKNDDFTALHCIRNTIIIKLYAHVLIGIEKVHDVSQEAAGLLTSSRCLMRTELVGFPI